MAYPWNFYQNYDMHYNENEYIEPQFICKICNKTFTRHGRMQEHISAVHEGDKKFKCEKCDFATGRAKQLKQHIEVVHNCSHKCDICEQCFSSAFKLKYHKESVHEGKTRFNCNLCDKHYSLEEGLTQHMEKVHDEYQRPYQRPHQRPYHQPYQPYEYQPEPAYFQPNISHNAFPGPWNEQYSGQEYPEPQHKCKICSKTFTRYGFT